MAAPLAMRTRLCSHSLESSARDGMDHHCGHHQVAQVVCSLRRLSAVYTGGSTDCHLRLAFLLDSGSTAGAAPLAGGPSSGTAPPGASPARTCAARRPSLFDKLFFYFPTSCGSIPFPFPPFPPCTFWSPCPSQAAGATCPSPLRSSESILQPSSVYTRSSPEQKSHLELQQAAAGLGASGSRVVGLDAGQGSLIAIPGPAQQAFGPYKRPASHLEVQRAAAGLGARGGCVVGLDGVRRRARLMAQFDLQLLRIDLRVLRRPHTSNMKELHGLST